MKIKIITGQQGVDLLKWCHNSNIDSNNKNVLIFPESKPCHSYDLCESIMEIIQEYCDKNEDLFIITWSEVILDSVRLWSARNCFGGAECINILKNGEVENVSINKNGEMEQWLAGVFDIKTVILRELFKYRNQK